MPFCVKKRLTSNAVNLVSLFITSFFSQRSDDSFCLDDAPSSTRPIPPESYYTRLPGELVDADTQCEYNYGTGYRRCPHINLEVNKSRLCFKKIKESLSANQALNKQLQESIRMKLMRKSQ